MTVSAQMQACLGLAEQKLSFFTDKNLTEQKFQVQKNGKRDTFLTLPFNQVSEAKHREENLLSNYEASKRMQIIQCTIIPTTPAILPE